MLSSGELLLKGEKSPRLAESYRWDDHRRWRGHSLDTPQSIKYGTPRGINPKGDSVYMAELRDYMRTMKSYY